jgi:hypothetical protein
LTVPGEVIEFQVNTPLDEPTIRRHIEASRGRGYPEALGEPQALRIIAGGPSALQAPLDGPTLALNGALRRFTSQGLAPTYYACCDPQEMVADFLKDAPESTIYFIASKCHPAVFDALKDRDVRLWHLDDYVPGGVSSAPSITLVALNLFAQLGWRAYDIWGWDACYKDGKHHAFDQGHNADDRTLEVGDRIFKTTTTWALEAQTAGQILPILQFVGVEVRIHGDSMIEAIRNLVAKAA